MDFISLTLLITQTVSCTARLATRNEHSFYFYRSSHRRVPDLVQRMQIDPAIFLVLDLRGPGCYRVHVQCRLCLQKSTENYRKHREDIKTARLAREQVHERVACVCGVTINVRYREKHCRSKRHQAVVALLNNAMSNAPAGGATAAAVKDTSSANRASAVTEEEQHQVPPAVPTAVRSRLSAVAAEVGPVVDFIRCSPNLHARRRQRYHHRGICTRPC